MPDEKTPNLFEEEKNLSFFKGILAHSTQEGDRLIHSTKEVNLHSPNFVELLQ